MSNNNNIRQMMNEKKKIANEVRKHKMAVIFCFSTDSEDKETKLLDEKDMNFQESVTQTPMIKPHYNELLEARFIVQNMEQDLDITNYDHHNKKFSLALHYVPVPP